VGGIFQAGEFDFPEGGSAFDAEAFGEVSGEVAVFGFVDEGDDEHRDQGAEGG
jgi:hypothetical protein